MHLKEFPILYALALLAPAGAVNAGAQALHAQVRVGPHTPTCIITMGDDVSFGANVRPGTGSGEITIDPVDAAVVRSNLEQAADSAAPQAGTAAIAMTHAASLVLDATFPAALEASSTSEEVAFDGAWAADAAGAGTYTLISGGSLTLTGPGQGATASAALRFGGTVSGITLSTEEATYRGTITLTGTCS